MSFLLVRTAPNPPKRAELETAKPGVVELYHDDVRVARRANDGASCGMAGLAATVVSSAGAEARLGNGEVFFVGTLDPAAIAG